MNTERIYIDTSVIGGCHDAEFAQWSNGLMLDFRGGLFKPVLSRIVTTEIASAPEFVQRTYMELLQLKHDFLDVSVESIRPANFYQTCGILTSKYFIDGLHIALATIASVDYMVSWNFKHIVRYDKIRAFNSVNVEQGYRSLQIYSPLEVTRHGKK